MNPEASSPPLSAPQHQDWLHRQHTWRFWLIASVLLILALLGVVYLYAVTQFKLNVTSNNAEHGRTSPAVHQIVHVRQVLRVGVGDSLPPMSFMTNGSLSGFEIDLARAIGTELNVPVEFFQYDFLKDSSGGGLDQHNPLRTGEVDIALNSMAITTARSQLFSFSQPYLEMGQVAITASNGPTVSSVSDLQGKKVATLANSSGHDFLSSSGDAIALVQVDSIEVAATKLQEEEAEVFITDQPHASALVSSNSSLKVASGLLTRETYGIAVRRDHSDLADEIDLILERLKQKGVIDSLRQKWLD